MNFFSTAVIEGWNLCSISSTLKTLAAFYSKVVTSETLNVKFKEKNRSNSSRNYPTVKVWSGIKISEIANLTQRPVGKIIQSVNAGLQGSCRVNDSSVIEDRDLLVNLLSLLGFRATFIGAKQKNSHILDAQPRPPPDRSICIPKPPVVAIMGHVDHGKTTLLDALRNSRIVDSEFGGITQHISAFSLSLSEAIASASRSDTNRSPFIQTPSDGVITFIDTPGHAAFSAMRARGAKATDIVLLVVAADDGVMPQTVESIRFAKEFNAQILVAINKMDKYDANSERTIQGLAANGVVVEKLGGDVQAIEISALRRTNLVALIEAIVAQSEIMQLTADPTGPAEALVLECHTEKGLGKTTVCLVTRGQLKQSSHSGPLVAGECIGRPRVIRNDRGIKVDTVPPGHVTSVAGWRELPHVGDLVLEVPSESEADAIVRSRLQRRLKSISEADQLAVKQRMSAYLSHYDTYLEKRKTLTRKGANELARNFRKNQSGLSLILESSKINELAILLIIKTDVEGSLEAIKDMLATCPSDSCRLQIAASGVGPLTLSEAELAICLNAEVFTFNISALPEAISLMENSMRTIRSHNIIYRLAEDVRSLINERLPPIYVEEVIGQATVLHIFPVSIYRGKRLETIVAGCRCNKGSILSGRLSRTDTGPVYFRALRPNDPKSRTNRPNLTDNEADDILDNSSKIVDQALCFSLRHGKNSIDSVHRDVEFGIILCEPNRIYDSLCDLAESCPSASLSDNAIFVDWQIGDIIQCYHVLRKTMSLDWRIDNSHMT